MGQRPNPNVASQILQKLNPFQEWLRGNPNLIYQSSREVFGGLDLRQGNPFRLLAVEGFPWERLAIFRCGVTAIQQVQEPRGDAWT